MPCAVSPDEERYYAAQSLLEYAELQTGLKGFGGDPTPALCAFLKKLKRDDVWKFDALVYNARDRMSRNLADWWEEHQKVDGR